ncbi:MCE-family protein MCE1A [Mycobacterium sp. Root135]|uniref:MCE family protein n=1 Tax=Mycobacterium sp. Root135 TaxID=1736457 RepID=UPI0006FA85B8|nr:MCE family protein [Mycobacterium sp. Root135]KQY02377.1 MCE-family protein MCE1A [Mycobacterium sp. Root135]
MAFDRHRPPYRLAGAVLMAIVVLFGVLMAKQYRGDFVGQTELVVMSDRAGLVVDPGSKVTLNGVEIGRVAGIDTAEVDGRERALIVLDVKDEYLVSIPSNVLADVRASTVFGNKYVSFRSPETPSAERVSPGSVIPVQSVTTEFNTLFETVTSIADKVDPVKLNQTLTATAQALGGLGTRFGVSLEDANAILADLNPRLPRFGDDVARSGELLDVYADAAPNLFDGLDSAVTTARSLNARRGDVDSALMAAIGFGDSAADPLQRAGPYFIRVAADLVPTTALLDDYRGMILCTLRNYHDVGPRIASSLGGDNGYSLAAFGTLTGAGNPYIYPDNLPRINARGGPEGRPGCWQKVTYDLWPHPYLVMDTGYSIAPYNHVELGQPLAVDHVWGRQIGELTINP